MPSLNDIPENSYLQDVLRWLKDHPDYLLRRIPGTWLNGAGWDGPTMVATVRDLNHLVIHPGIPITFHAKLFLELNSHWSWGPPHIPTARSYAERILERMTREMRRETTGLTPGVVTTAAYAYHQAAMADQHNRLRETLARDSNLGSRRTLSQIIRGFNQRVHGT